MVVISGNIGTRHVTFAIETEREHTRYAGKKN
jgi:hypothetical protein